MPAVSEKQRRTHDHYVGMIDGKSAYVAKICGHNTSNPGANRCRPCHTLSQFKNGPSFLRQDGYRTFNQNGKQRLEHVIIAETVLGRRFKKGECAHHINMIKHDNRHKNLLICTTSYNTWLLKRYAEKYAQEHFSA